jgi:hypothetical protein
MDFVELDTIPETYETPLYDMATGLVVNKDALKWSNGKPPPAIGQKVYVRFNAMKTGTVIGYFIEGNYLGLRVKLDNEPEWRKKQYLAGRPALVFGIAVEY